MSLCEDAINHIASFCSIEDLLLLAQLNNNFNDALFNNEIYYQLHSILQNKPASRDEIIAMAIDRKYYDLIHFFSLIMPPSRINRATLDNPRFLADIVKYKPKLPKIAQCKHFSCCKDLLQDLLLNGELEMASKYITQYKEYNITILCDILDYNPSNKVKQLLLQNIPTETYSTLYKLVSKKITQEDLFVALYAKVNDRIHRNRIMFK